MGDKTNKAIPVNTYVLWKKVSTIGTRSFDSSEPFSLSGRVVSANEGAGEICEAGQTRVFTISKYNDGKLPPHGFCIPTKHLYPLTPGQKVFYRTVAYRVPVQHLKLDPNKESEEKPGFRVTEVLTYKNVYKLTEGRVVAGSCGPNKIPLVLNSKPQPSQSMCIRANDLVPPKNIPAIPPKPDVHFDPYKHIPCLQKKNRC